MKLRLAHLYPKLMNIYGDRGNIIALRRRCQARGIEFEVTELELGDRFNPAAYEMAFIGGAQDVEQHRVAEDFRSVKGPALKEAVEDDLVLLAVCGGYQLAGQYYRGADGDELPGAGILDLHTEHPGPGAKRFIGNVVVDWNHTTLVGFENHGGRTYLGEGVKPLGRVVTGHGNCGDGREGAVYRNAFGTYLHGSLLPKNPRFGDHLLTLALRQTYGPDVALGPLNDMVEDEAHAEALRLATRRSIMLRLGRR
jgi:CobQ-like glutamine amidotransferase family enzyme